MIPHFATYRAIIVRYPIKTSTKEFCDTIATSIAQYEKYRCWASKEMGGEGGLSGTGKGPIPVGKRGGRRRHKMVTTIWCRFDSP